MTKIFNDPAEFAEDQLAGFLDLYADRVRGVPGGVVSLRSGDPQVAVVIGGGSGHYPAFCGTVGPGFATGAVVGNIFTSPSAAQAYSVAKAADQGRGVIFSFGNYAGDTMNFGIAAERLRAEGIDARIVIVTDDVASADEAEKRRGIAGDFSVFKVMGAAAAAGKDIDEVERLGRKANDATRSFGVAFSGCTMPGADEPLFTVAEGKVGLGLGIHGEPGIRDEPLMSADELAELFVDKVLANRPDDPAGDTVAPILNGLGTTKYEELFLLWGRIAALLAEKGITVVQPEVGELVTSLDMGGCSLTLMWLDDELDEAWRADAYTPAYRKLGVGIADLRPPSQGELAEEAAEQQAPEATEAARAAAGTARTALQTMQQVLHDAESELGRIDAVAGDGDHGRGMVKGIDAAVKAADAVSDEAGVAWTLRRAGQAWAEYAGGTSGVLWGAALEAFGTSLTDDAEAYSDADVVAATRAFADAISQLGGAKLGDKTLLDALLPFVDTLQEKQNEGLAVAWPAAARVADEQAKATAELRPQVGRARPLAEKSVGTPDAGATSMALLLVALGDQLNDTSHRKEQR